MVVLGVCAIVLGEFWVTVGVGIYFWASGVLSIIQKVEKNEEERKKQARNKSAGVATALIGIAVKLLGIVALLLK